MLTLKQVQQLKKHSKEAVESLPEDHEWIHFLGSLDVLCDTALALYVKEPHVQADACKCNPAQVGWINTFNGPMCTLCNKIRTA